MSLSANRQDVEHCVRVIRQYDLLTPPVVGNFPDGARLVLSGECEFLALREMGVRSVEAVVVPVLEEQESSSSPCSCQCYAKAPMRSARAC